ncbi:MAG TPA: ABC transporter permease [Candidatus Polarisedimenticolaceae bacterium]|nr:ABC transporter permease [Candidatus Polarisedimenticolaceae bacterium]
MRIGIVRTANIVKVGLRSILRNTMRSALTMLGIVIGVTCVIVVNGIGNGATKSIQSNISSLGANYIMVFPGQVTQGGARIAAGVSSLTEDDARAIKTECPSIAYVSAGARTAGQVVAGELNWGTEIFGADVDWPFIRSWNVSRGTFFSEAEVKASAKVAVLGATVQKNLFPDSDPIGAVIRIKNVPFRVLGVLERKGGSTMGNDQDDQIVVPYTTVMKRISGSNRLNIVQVAAKGPDAIQPAIQEITALLRQRHRLGPGQDDDFTIRSQEEFAATAAATTQTMRYLLVGIAIVSLVVGGIGIMNIMLVSVTERTREIGIRMAIGAKAHHVLAQFLLEAITLSIVGGGIGILLGLGGSRAVAKFAGWPVSVDPSSIVIAFATAAIIGVFFGFWPAWKAAKLDPIEALRYE